MSNATLRGYIAVQNAITSLQDDSGQTLVEYSLAIAVVSLAAIVGATVLGDNLNVAFTDLACQLPGANCVP